MESGEAAQGFGGLEQLFIDLGILCLFVKKGLGHKPIGIQSIYNALKACMYGVQRVKGGGELLLGGLLGIGDHPQLKDLHQKHGAEQQRNQGYGQKGGVQLLPERAKVKLLHSSSSDPR